VSQFVWTIVLAAGAGRRLSAVTGGVPKQFWQASGSDSLLDQTLERFGSLSTPDRTLVVVDERHRPYVERLRRPVGSIVYQPEDRGTAAGVLLPLTEVPAEAVVVVTPADHGVVDDRRFREGVAAGVRLAGQRDAVVVFGVEPDRPCDDYGWIAPGPPRVTSPFRHVDAFVEKPEISVARQLFASGAAWNTMVVVARAGALWDLFMRTVPDLALIFKAAARVPSSERAGFLAGAYPHLRSCDFCRDVLGRAPRLDTYVWPASVGWTDLGTPERLAHWLRSDHAHDVA